MIRPLTLVSLLAAGGAGLYLYQVKHSVSLLDRELRDLHRRIEATREHTRVLHAEWALLNEPERLRQVAGRYLADLVPMAPTQFVRPQELERRLPQPVAFAGASAPFGSPLLTMPNAPAPGSQRAAAAAPPPRVAGAGPDGGHAAAAGAAAMVARAGEARSAAVGPAPPVPGAATPAALRGASEPAAPRLAVAAPARPRDGEPPPRAAAEAPPAAVVPAAVSALGGTPSRALAPPVPFGAVGAAVAASFPPPAPSR